MSTYARTEIKVAIMEMVAKQHQRGNSPVNRVTMLSFWQSYKWVAFEVMVMTKAREKVQIWSNSSFTIGSHMLLRHDDMK